MNDTVADLIKYLQTLPPETKVQVLTIESCGYETYTKWLPMNLESNVYFYKGLKIVEFGDK